MAPRIRVAQPGKAEDAQTAVHVQRFAVAFEYPVYFTERLFDPANPVLVEALGRLEPERRHRCLVFVDDGLLGAGPGSVRRSRATPARTPGGMELVCAPLPIPGGERIKSELFFVEQMQQRLHEHNIDRHSYVIAIGGGAVLDAVGLVAARDPSRGAPDPGADHRARPGRLRRRGQERGQPLRRQELRRHLRAAVRGAERPRAADGALRARDKIAGIAEAVKVALIRDGAFFAWLERHADELLTFERAAMAAMIRRCAELHMHQIAHGGDPFETGSARPLDYGHWSAHKLESLTEHHLRHGEAVAIGIALDARYSVLAGLLDGGRGGADLRAARAPGLPALAPGARRAKGATEGSRSSRACASSASTSAAT